MLLRGYKWIEVDPEKRAGKPTIRGTRVAVEDVLKALSSGWDVKEVAEMYEVPVEAVREAIRFSLDVMEKVEIVVSR